MRAQGAFLLSVAVCAACGSTAAGARDVGGGASQGAASAQASDSVAVSRYLISAHCAARRIVSGDLSRFAILMQRSPLCRLGTFLTARVTGNSVSVEDRTGDIGGKEATTIEWKTVAHLNGPALEVIVDEPAEGWVWTTVYGDAGRGLSPIYSDQPKVCAPARLRDVDGDGDAELLSYQEDPASGDCAEPCHEAIATRFGTVPAWVGMQNWDGRAWVSTERKHPAFYRAAAKTYRSMDAWLKQGGDSIPCAGVYWLRDTTLFTKWAARSDSLAEGAR